MVMQYKYEGRPVFLYGNRRHKDTRYVDLDVIVTWDTLIETPIQRRQKAYALEGFVGKEIYIQHYNWKCQWDPQGKLIVQR